MWRSIYLPNFVNITTTSVTPLERISVEILIQFLILLHMVGLHCKNPQAIFIHGNSMQYSNLLSFSFVQPSPDLISPGLNSFVPKAVPQNPRLSDPTGLVPLVPLGKRPRCGGSGAAMRCSSWVLPSCPHTSHLHPPQLPLLLQGNIC